MDYHSFTLQWAFRVVRAVVPFDRTTGNRYERLIGRCCRRDDSSSHEEARPFCISLVLRRLDPWVADLVRVRHQPGDRPRPRRRSECPVCRRSSPDHLDKARGSGLESPSRGSLTGPARPPSRRSASITNESRMPWRHPALAFPPTPGKSEAERRLKRGSGCRCRRSSAAQGIGRLSGTWCHWLSRTT